MVTDNLIAMKKYLGIFIVTGFLAVSFTACEDKIDPISGELDFDRLLGVGGFTADVRDISTIRLSWNLRDDVDHYVVELHEDSLEFSNPVYTSEVLPSQAIPYYQFNVTMAGETVYSARVKGVSAAGKNDSKWSVATVRTPTENIFQPISVEDVLETDVTLTWPAGSEVTHIILNPGNINRVISAGEKAAGSVTIENLNTATSYTATLYNNDKRRGVISFKTLSEPNVFPTDDLVDRINSATEGDVLILAPGDYAIGTAFVWTKSITIEGQKPFDKPVVTGSFACGAAVSTGVVLKNLVFEGTGIGQFINTQANCDMPSLTIDGCEIRNYDNQLIYNNSIAGAKYGAIKILNSYVHDMPGSGGDGIDFRGGEAVGSLTVENTTFANGFRTFLRMQVQCNTIFKNCTFYKISNNDNGNNHGLFRSSGGGTFEVRNCLFVETGVPGINDPANSRGNFCRQASNMVPSPVYASNNIYGCHNIFGGLYTSASQVSATELDPGLQDPENGNFKITNATLIDNNIGDMKWQ